MQTIARHIERLSITELEIVTVPHTTLIIGIYICWWNKPLGVTQPFRVSKSVWDVVLEKDSLPLMVYFMRSLTGELDSIQICDTCLKWVLQGLMLKRTNPGFQGSQLEIPPVFNSP